MENRVTHRKMVFGVILLAIFIGFPAGAIGASKESKKSKPPEKKEVKAKAEVSELAKITSAVRPSLRKLTEDWGDQAWVTGAFKAESLPSAKEPKLPSSSEGALKDFLAAARVGTSFARGEIEDEKTLNGLVQMLQWSLVQTRLKAAAGDSAWVQENLGDWLKFAADFPYEESTLVGLKVASVLRALIFDELEQMEALTAAGDPKKETAEKIAESWVLWTQRLRAPWPIDRVILSESRRILPAPLQGLGAQTANQLQKNPYQTADSILNKLSGGKAEAANFLRQMWTDQDLSQMKTEITRLHRLQLRWAYNLLQSKAGKLPQTILEVAKAAGFDRVPVNYQSGKAWELSELGPSESTKID